VLSHLPVKFHFLIVSPRFTNTRYFCSFNFTSSFRCRYCVLHFTTDFCMEHSASSVKFLPNATHKKKCFENDTPILLQNFFMLLKDTDYYYHRWVIEWPSHRRSPTVVPTRTKQFQRLAYQANLLKFSAKSLSLLQCFCFSQIKIISIYFIRDCQLQFLYKLLMML
jgi:hypothetical protein